MNKLAVIGESAENLISPLERRGYTVIVMPRFSLLNSPICSHPDTLFARIGRYIITSKEYYEAARSQLDAIYDISGSSLLLDDVSQSSPYPNEARFNVFSSDGFVIGNKNIASPKIFEACEKQNLQFIHVNQGYSACSTARCFNGGITADNGIYSALASIGTNSLKIRPGHIKLEKYEYGFIGGAAGFDDSSNTMYFNGDVSTHPDSSVILEFLKSSQTNVVSLTGGPLVDCGGIVFF